MASIPKRVAIPNMVGWKFFYNPVATGPDRSAIHHFCSIIAHPKRPKILQPNLLARKADSKFLQVSCYPRTWQVNILTSQSKVLGGGLLLLWLLYKRLNDSLKKRMRCEKKHPNLRPFPSEVIPRRLDSLESTGYFGHFFILYFVNFVYCKFNN